MSVILTLEEAMNALESGPIAHLSAGLGQRIESVARAQHAKTCAVIEAKMQPVETVDGWQMMLTEADWQVIKGER